MSNTFYSNNVIILTRAIGISVNLMKYKDAYQHFEDALERAKLLSK
jgi:hypothetical protein